MTNRHRVPTVFSIYMLDVICCALGCVILLWQLKNDEAEQQTEAARQAEAAWKLASSRVSSVTAEVASLQAALEDSRQRLEESRQKHELLSIDLARAEKDRDEAKRLVLLRQKEYDELRQAYLLSEALLKGVRGDLAKSQEQYKLAATDLAAKVKANAELLLQITAAEKKAGELEKQVAAKQLDVQEAARRLQEQLARLQDSEEKNRGLEKQASALRTEGKGVLAKLTATELRVKMLEQELDRSKKELTASGVQRDDLARAQEALGKEVEGAKRTIATLQGEKAALAERALAIQAEADRRFAGIALTGQNVLFLVDMSGSMAMTDENTFDPDKWPLVCDTVGQLMQSIKGLQYYQVLLFSDKVRYPMGSPATWLKYNPKETPKKAVAALKATKPEGETNMHAVFAEAFRYREAGMDTIYLLSDGLPNAGDGLPPGFDKLSTVQQTEYLSKNLRGKLKNDWNRPIAGQKRVRINSVGFFFESPDVGAFLWALSREHDGSFVGMSK
jgi:hypothetical protein